MPPKTDRSAISTDEENSSLWHIQFGEPCVPPNDNGYERTLCWTEIDQAVAALTPFVDITAANAAGFDTSKLFAFQPFTPTLPNPLGDFVSFAGC